MDNKKIKARNRERHALVYKGFRKQIINEVSNILQALLQLQAYLHNANKICVNLKCKPVIIFLTPYDITELKQNVFNIIFLFYEVLTDKQSVIWIFLNIVTSLPSPAIAVHIERNKYIQFGGKI